MFCMNYYFKFNSIEDEKKLIGFYINEYPAKILLSLVLINDTNIITITFLSQILLIIIFISLV